jgi:hypothetical protein
MQKIPNLMIVWSRAIMFAAVCLTAIQCSDEDILQTPTEQDPTISATSTDCGCTYTVPPSTNSIFVDGNTLGLKPGAVICLKGGATYKNITFKNIRGSASAPITIKNCGGTVTFNATGTYYGIKTQSSSYFRITGGSGTTYGIKVNGGHHSVTLEYLTTNVEFDHVEVANSGFSGIMAKTDPSCDNATIRGNFVMRDVKIHDNYVHDTKGEGLYLGHTFWSAGISTPCGQRYPHPIEGLKVYNNVVKNSGWEAIQVGSTPTGADVYNNRIENYGVANKLYQNNGVQFSEAGIGKFYGNFIKGGKGTGLLIMGNPQNFVHNNVFINTGADAIFCEDRSTGAGFKFINNTIINPGGYGIRLYSDEVTMNLVYNNLIVNPGKYATVGNNAYISLLNTKVKAQILNNHQTRDINSVKFVAPTTDNYALTSASPARDKGTGISTLGIPVDFANKPRLSGALYDIGAYEYQY